MTRKPMHPIRRMLKGLYRAGMAPPFDPADLEPVIARHVKPLLDALEGNHTGLAIEYPASFHPNPCPDCQLIAAWRAKL